MVWCSTTGASTSLSSWASAPNKRERGDTQHRTHARLALSRGIDQWLQFIASSVVGAIAGYRPPITVCWPDNETRKHQIMLHCRQWSKRVSTRPNETRTRRRVPGLSETFHCSCCIDKGILREVRAAERGRRIKLDTQRVVGPTHCKHPERVLDRRERSNRARITQYRQGRG